MAGSEAELDRLLKEGSDSVKGDTTQILALVDEHGNVLQAQPRNEQTPAALIEQAKATKLPALLWPGHKVRSVRVLDFSRNGQAWELNQSFAGPIPGATPVL